MTSVKPRRNDLLVDIWWRSRAIQGDQVMVHHPCSTLRLDVLASLELSSELALADDLE